MTTADGVAGAGYQLLAGAGLAVHQQGRIECGDAQGAGLEGADRRGVAEQGIEAFGVIMVQRRETFAHAIGRIQGEQAAGIGDRRCIQQQALAIELHLAHRQVEVVVEQRRVGQQHLASAVHRQYRVAHGREQGVELQVSALAGEDIDHFHRLHAAHLEQRIVQLFEHGGAERGSVDVDVRWHHFHGIEVEVAGTEQGQDFLGDADAVDKADVDAHGGNGRGG